MTANKKPNKANARAKQTVTIASEVAPVKLDLGSGKRPKDGFAGVDLYAPEATFKVDLTSGKRWPWADSSVDELHCSHFIEHIEKGNRHETYTGQGNLFLFFFDECYRILKPGATMSLQWPALQSVRAFQDPTHCDYIPMQRLLYLDAQWRAANQLDHYLGACDFVMEMCSPTMSMANSLRAAQVQQEKFVSDWNFSEDFVATLRSRKT